MSLGRTTQIDDSMQSLMRRRIVIAEKDPRSRERLRHALHEIGLDIAGLAMDGQEAIQMANGLDPDFVLLDENLTVVSAYDAAAAIQATAPNVAPIIISEQTGPDVMHRAMLYGARDVIRKPLDINELRNTLLRLDEIHRTQMTPDFGALLDPSRLPSVFCVTGGKGGVGKTMIATNLALALRERNPKTILVDLYTQFGDIAAVLNLEPKRTLAELAGLTDEIDWSLLSNYIHKHQSGLHALFTSNRPLILDALPVVVLDKVVSLLKREYKYIVFDVPPYLHATTLHAMSVSTAVMLICNLFDYTTIADTKALFETLDGAYVSRDRLKLVVNRVTAQNRFQVDDLERSFGHPIFMQLPNEPRVVSMVNTGYSGHGAVANLPLGEAVRTLVDKLTELPAQSATTPLLAQPQAKQGLITRWKSVFGGASA